MDYSLAISVVFEERARSLQLFPKLRAAPRDLPDVARRLALLRYSAMRRMKFKSGLAWREPIQWQVGNVTAS